MRKYIAAFSIMILLMLTFTAVCVYADEELSFVGISVKQDNNTYAQYITAGTLESVSIKKNSDISKKLSVYGMVYGKNGVLEQCKVKELNTATAFSSSDTVKLPLSLKFSSDIREKRVKFIILDSKVTPVTVGYDSLSTKDQGYALTIEGKDGLLIADSIIGDDGDIYLPARQLVNLMGMAYNLTDGQYWAESDSGKKITFDKKASYYNGKTYLAQERNGIMMLPLKLLSDAFGVTASADEFAAVSTASVSSQAEKLSAPPSGLISYYAAKNSISYEINASATAKVEVWYTRGYKVPYIGVGWHRAQEPVYSNGKWVGGIAGVPRDKYDFRIRITENGVTKTYDDYAEIWCDGIPTQTLAETVGTTAGELVLNPTYENIGYKIDIGLATNCQVTYREKGKGWSLAYTPQNDGLQFRGSIVGLKAGTEYEVKAVLTDASGATVSTKTAKVTTQSDEPTVTKTIKLSQIYDGGGLLISGYHGTEDGWIKIVDDKNTVIDADDAYMETVLVNDCSYVILEGFTVRGGYRYGINVADNSKHIRITNCDISQWGRVGTLDETRGRYHSEGADINFDSGIIIYNGDHITVERCYIHNSKAQTNSWKTANWSDVHPQGGCGIYYSSKDSVVIRYNDIIGNYNHLFNDGIEGISNSSRMGGAANNCDIYGNMIYQGEDDGMEIDGGQLNSRVYQNRIERFYCGVSLAPNQTGPSYLFRNLIVNLGTTYNDRNYTALKIGGSTDKVFGMHYLFNNTLDSNASAVTNSNYSGTSEYHSVSANNIFVTRKNTSNSFGFRNIYADERDNNNYDLVGGKFYIGTDADGKLISGTSVAKNSLSGYPIYVNQSKGNYHLAASSPGVAKGTYVDNFCEESKPNMGIYSKNDTTSFMPYRPIDVQSDRYSIIMLDGKSQTVTLTFGEDIQEESFKILTDNKWLATNIKSGTITAGTTVSFTVNADFSKAETSDEYGDEKYGMLLVRFNNGYSIPISVILSK